MTEDKTKVKDLATELGVPTKNLLQALRELDIPAKSTSSNIAAEDIDRVKNHLKDSATSEQGDRREVQPGVIVRRRRQSTEDVAAEGEEAPRTERRAPRENHTPTARIVSVPGASEAQDAAPVPSAEPEAPAAPEVSVQEPVKDAAEEKPAPVVEADKADDQKPRQPRDNRQKKRSGLREAAPVAKVISRPQDIAAAKAAEEAAAKAAAEAAAAAAKAAAEAYYEDGCDGDCDNCEHYDWCPAEEEDEDDKVLFKGVTQGDVKNAAKGGVELARETALAARDLKEALDDITGGMNLKELLK